MHLIDLETTKPVLRTRAESMMQGMVMSKVPLASCQILPQQVTVSIDGFCEVPHDESAEDLRPLAVLARRGSG